MTILLTINICLLIWLVMADRSVNIKLLGHSPTEMTRAIRDIELSWIFFILCSAINLFILITEGWV